MSLPEIKNECVNAVMEKATQVDPSLYAVMSIMKINESQPNMAAAIATIANELGEAIGVLTKDSSPEAVGDVLKVVLSCMGCAVFEIVNATVEAQEMEEQWS